MEPITEHPENWLVAHRGDHEHGVENTLAAFKRAAASGARFAECDIQFSRDLVPVVIHDDYLKRLCDLALHVSLLELIDLEELCYPCFKLLTLATLLAWLEKQPDLTLFIEVKPDIRQRLSCDEIAIMLDKHIPESLRRQIVLISQSGQILDACRTPLACRTGWVGEDGEAPESNPDYIFMPYSEAATIKAWHARGVKVGLYTVNDAQLAVKMLGLGADLIESDHFSRLSDALKAGHGNT